MKFWWLCLISLAQLGAAEVTRVTSPAIPGLDRTEMWFAKTASNPRAVLVLCPGMNGSAEAMVRDKTWQTFASRNKIGLAGLSFSSDPKELYDGRGYTFPEQGSGDLLLQNLRKEYGADLPLLLYGFSSGALFTELFVAWKPDLVLGWCAHGTGHFEKNPGKWPPGLVSCGQLDSQRYGAALTHFKKGRSAGGSLLWIGLPRTSHEWPPELHEFVRKYFAALMDNHSPGLWVDVDSEKTIPEFEASREPSLSGWLPSKDLEQPWKALNDP